MELKPLTPLYQPEVHFKACHLTHSCSEGELVSGGLEDSEPLARSLPPELSLAFPSSCLASLSGHTISPDMFPETIFCVVEM